MLVPLNPGSTRAGHRRAERLLRIAAGKVLLVGR